MSLARWWTLLLLRCARAIETAEIKLPGWTSNPVARHLACPVESNVPSVCRLVGFEDTSRELKYYVQTLPTAGLLYETSTNFRALGSDPRHAPDPIGPHQLPFLVTDPLHRLVYLPPFNAWPPEGSWASFKYTVKFEQVVQLQTVITESEAGLVVLTTPEGGIAGSTFDVEETGGSGWSVSGNFAPAGADGGGLKHQAFVWGAMSHYVYGVDEVQHLDFATGLDQAKWYFEASPAGFYRPELAAAYGGKLRFTVRSLYGNFSELNRPLDWVTLECASCDSGRGVRLVRFVDEYLRWDGSERVVELSLLPIERWLRDPLNAVLEFNETSECDIAAVLTNLSRVAILGDFTRAGEGVALDDVAILAAAPAAQPAYPVKCQKGCSCRHNAGLVRPTCC